MNLTRKSFSQMQIDGFMNGLDTSGDCWVWKRGKTEDGYGRVRINKVLLLAHRVSLAISGVKVPSNKCVLHKCDNPPCCNPNHLYLGSRLDNAKDRDRRGRRDPLKISGEKHWMAVLTDEKVIRIRKLYSDGIRQADISREMGVSDGIISHVVNGNSWKHVK